MRVVCPVLVGREAPLASARALIARARGADGDAQGGTLLIAGEAGVGKSRLLHETIADARAAGFLVLQGACFEADRSIPYAPLVDLVRGFATTTSPALAAHALAPASGDLVATFPELASLFPDAPPLQRLDPEHERRRLFDALAQTLIGLGRTQPVLVAIEDVHWGDEATLDLVLHLARRSAAHRVVIAISYRSDEVGPRLARVLAELDRTRLAVEVSLAPLTRAELSTMIAEIFGGAAPGGAFHETIHALTEGNPFFVEEMLKGLVSTGDLARHADGAWHVRSPARLQVPRTAVDAVRRRLSTLSAAAREVASVAAVAGRRFDFALIQALTGHDERALLAHMKELIAAQLVAEESPDRFAFRHALTREAIAGELLARERAALHRAVADALERANASGGAADALAYHTYEAGDWPRALHWSARAADHALALHAPREALAHLDRALGAAKHAGLVPDAALRLARGRALETLGELQGAHDEFTAALDAARVDHRERDAWQALHALGILWAARDYARAGEYRRDALALARTIGDDSLIARSLNRVANWHVNLEQPAPALRDHAEAIALFERLGDRRGIAETVDLIAMTHFMAGDMVQSAAHYERAIALNEAIGERRSVASALALLAMTTGGFHISCTRVGQSNATREILSSDRPIRIAREIGWRAGEAFTLYVLADALAWHGQYDRALPLARESVAIAREMAHMQWECGALRALGMMLLDLGAVSDARDALVRAHEIAVRLGSPTWTRWSGAPLAMALARLGAAAEARALLEHAARPAALGRDALRPGDEDSPTLGQRYLALARVEVALDSEQPAEALRLVDERIAEERAAAARSKEQAISLPRLSLLRAKALLALDRLDEAEATSALALDEAEASEAPSMQWRTLALIGQLQKKQRRRAESRASFDRARVVAAAIAARLDDEALRATFERLVDQTAPAGAPPSAREASATQFGGLTRREREVATLVAQGKANRAIAKALGLGERTIESYVAGALAKLGFSSRTQLAAWAVEHGLATATSERRAR